MSQLINLPSLKKISFLTVLAVYFLIAVGGIVRSTGSGMGCPDWPKCFGNWVPPTEASQLPPDYKEHYASLRAEKNERFAQYLDKFGFVEQAELIRTDESILVEEDFNAAKTWTEYVNRLIGALIGVFIILTFLSSVKTFKAKPKLTYLSFFVVLLVGFQGWIGSIVVSTNLLEWMITIHMLLAIAIVLLLIYIYQQSKDDIGSKPTETSYLNRARWFIVICMVLTTVQVVLGTQVREMVDQVSNLLGEANRHLWIDSLGLNFKIHRSFSILIMIAHFFMFKYLFAATDNNSGLKSTFFLLAAVVLLEIFSGVIMAYFAIPPALQPVHLLFGTVAIGIQFFILLELNKFYQPVKMKDSLIYS